MIETSHVPHRPHGGVAQTAASHAPYRARRTMLATPWGDADDLGARVLPPGPGTAREDVLRNRRERLFAAMVRSVAERGYEATTVANLTEIACVSRSAFYEQFASKQDCFVATVGEIVELGRAATLGAFARDGSWDDRLLAALETIIGLVALQPATARLCYVDAYAAGPEAIASAESSLTDFNEMARGAIAESPERVGLAPEIVAAVMGGFQVVVEDHVRSRREHELPARVPALWRWALSYETPKDPVRKARVPGGPAGTARRIAHDPEERILGAMAETVAERGYGVTTVADVAAAASVSLSTFYAHFEGKEDAFLATLERGRAQAFAAVLPAFQRGSDWPLAVRAGLKALFAFLAVETAWAEIATQVRCAGERAAAYGQETMCLFGELLTPGQEAADDMPGVTRTAVGGAVFALVTAEIANGRVARLPEVVPMATFLALAPFVGSDLAAEVANAETSSRTRREGNSRCAL